MQDMRCAHLVTFFFLNYWLRNDAGVSEISDTHITLTLKAPNFCNNTSQQGKSEP